MQITIEKILQRKGKLKAKKIALLTGVTRKEVNQFLYSHEDLYTKDEENFWDLAGNKPIIRIGGAKWVSAKELNKCLQEAGDIFGSDNATIRLVIEPNVSILIDAAAMLLSLCNQLSVEGVAVELDFSRNTMVRGYLYRMGFVKLLHKDVVVKPQGANNIEPRSTRNPSSSLFELSEILPGEEEGGRLPVDLCNKLEPFLSNGSVSIYRQVFAELIGNVRHADTQITSFVGLQAYSGARPNVKIVISDSGKGIIAQLKPSMFNLHSELITLYRKGDKTFEEKVLFCMFSKGSISKSYDEEDRREDKLVKGGMGLSYLGSLGCNISVRQSNFSVTFISNGGELYMKDVTKELPRIKGTHICCEFFLTTDHVSR